MKTFIAHRPEDYSDIAKQLLAQYPDDRLFAFFGEMGAGKTTFIKALCESLEVIDSVCSPTFSIVNEYQRKDGSPVFHFDFYRIEKLQEVYDIGYEEYLYSGDYCFIEWPEKMEELLPEGFVKVEILVEADSGYRIINL